MWVSSITFSNTLRSLLAYRPDATGLAYESHLVAWKPQSFWSSLVYQALVEELDSKLPSRTANLRSLLSGVHALSSSPSVIAKFSPPEFQCLLRWRLGIPLDNPSRLKYNNYML